MRLFNIFDGHQSRRLNPDEITIFVELRREIWSWALCVSFLVRTSKGHFISLCYRKYRTLQDHNTIWSTEKQIIACVFQALVADINESIFCVSANNNYCLINSVNIEQTSVFCEFPWKNKQVKGTIGAVVLHYEHSLIFFPFSLLQCQWHLVVIEYFIIYYIAVLLILNEV